MGKTEAQALYDEACAAIRAGRLTTTGRPVPEPPAETGTSVDLVIDAYLHTHVRKPGRTPRAVKATEDHLALLRRMEIPGDAASQPIRFASKPIATVTKADIEAVRVGRRTAIGAAMEVRAEVKRLRETGERPPRALLALSASVPNTHKGGEVGIDRLLARLRHLFNWACGEGHLDQSPFKRHGVNVVKLTRVDEARARRLARGEESRLRVAASAHLADLIVAAIETGCRVGELLSMQWRQVRWEQNEVFLPGSKTKTHERRETPISEALRAVLERRALDQLTVLIQDMLESVASVEHEWSALQPAYVFGNEAGEAVRSVDSAWASTCVRAEITDLRFHDLRHEAGSRRLEEGWPLHAVSRWLGHKNITPTARYLNADRILLHQLTNPSSWPSRAGAAAMPMVRANIGRTFVAHSDPPPTESVEDDPQEVLDFQGLSW